ncbi:hypothetical protein PFICI_05044 [Pestalotiopsis fici W106-1]|uniref:Aminotransferase class I/classII large domain-containing protein n=1 Tax=Pestalotiopsis fici (strain W106-1 / CGMCC3.15140) TaxID=1229662 RepID=W3XAP6_PESFW|nr:uncharacterized protein PFICI_05044 [Pestalotiopsis fici W106-1]ETS83168.1 hypothetical protein PFICI_05044 [Pestalotiopsis fici W106-1]
MSISPGEHLTYSIGPRGSLRLRDALSKYFNEHFCPSTQVAADNLYVTPGLASCIDSIAWALCDPDDGILIPRPYYNGFTVDITHRSHVQVVGVDYADISRHSSMNDLFRPEINTEALEAALSKSKTRGINIRALLISQPHNPLGRCYPPETLKAFLGFCSRHQIHLISDEIYAKSVFQNPSMADPTPFTSVMAVSNGLIDPLLLHVMYGASKDFCANGLRLGVLYTQNQGAMLTELVKSRQFAWSPHLVQDIWATMLNDKKWLDTFFTLNHELMAKNHSIATAFFQSHKIDYFESNAGVFIWVDLGRYMLPQRFRSQGHSSRLRSNMSEADLVACIESESRLAATCIECGVMISPGSIYASEEFGWYRVTFTLPEAALREGLHRMGKALEFSVQE